MQKFTTGDKWIKTQHLQEDKRMATAETRGSEASAGLLPRLVSAGSLVSGLSARAVISTQRTLCFITMNIYNLQSKGISI